MYLNNLHKRYTLMIVLLVFYLGLSINLSAEKSTGEEPFYSLVISEFAHKIDVNHSPYVMVNDTLTPRVMMPTGDNEYDSCGEGNSDGIPDMGQGLFNQATLDTNNDGMSDIVDSTCADLPYLRLEKALVSSTQNNDGSHTIVYTLSVENVGGAVGEYNLSDNPQYDDDIIINTATYTSNVGLSGTLSSTVTPWSLASDEAIDANETDVYTVTVNVTLDLNDGDNGDDSYDPCGGSGGSGPTANQGLFNEALLDVNDDGTADVQDTVCSDLPFLVMEKSLVSLTQVSGNIYSLVYQINVENQGGADGMYDLTDNPQYDDDIAINSASYTSNIGLNGTLTSSPWLLGDDETIGAGEIDSYIITVQVEIDLESSSTGDNMYSECGSGSGDGTSSAGEGLFNEALLDTDNDGTAEVLDTVCNDLPFLILDKEFVNSVQNTDGSYTITYTIEVENIGGADGLYNLDDSPQYDDDVVINSASYSATNGLSGTLTTTPWDLADDETIAAGEIDTYTLTVNIDLELNDGVVGDDTYTACGSGGGSGPSANQGLFNQALLDIDDDGDADVEDEVCEDLPYLEMEKTFVSTTQTTANCYTVVYQITVSNNGGAEGTYDLSDNPAFDDDITINSISYGSDASGNTGGSLSVDTTLPLADDQSIAIGKTDTYILTFDLCLDLDD